MKIIKNPFFAITVYCLLIVLTGCRKQKVALPQPSSVEEEGVVPAVTTEPAKPTKSVKQMTVEEALEAAEYYEFINHQASLVATYQHIISKSKDPDIVATYLIKLADLHFIDNNFDEAKKNYKKATTLYPGHKGIEGARYREVLTHFLSSLNPSRDQSATQATITLGKKYLTDFPHVQPDRVRSIIAAAYKKLLMSELLVVNFYLNKFKLSDIAQPIKAALQRMQNIVVMIIPQLKLYDTEFARLQSDAEWSQHVLMPWDELQAKDLDTNEARTRVALKLQEAVVSLQTVVDPEGLKTLVASDLRDRF